MNECKNTSQIAAYHDAELDPQVRREVEAHLASCAECRAELRALQRLSTQFATVEISPMTNLEIERLHQSIPYAPEASPVRFWGGLMAIAASILVVCAAWRFESPPAVSGTVVATAGPQEPWERVAMTLRVDQPISPDASGLADWMVAGLSKEEQHERN